MRILGVGEYNDLGDMYLRLIDAGHEVRVYRSDERSKDVMQGMIEFVPDWRDSLDWIRDAGQDGVVVFETSTSGSDQDELRKDGFRVVGGSSLGDRLEKDRAFGQQILREHGLNTACSHEFSSFGDAIAFLDRSPGRYVLKLSGSHWLSMRNYVGQMDDARDMIALLTAMTDMWDTQEHPEFILMEFVEGVEIGVGAFFNGERFLGPPNLDWEHKKFFPGDIGELTGEMGTVVTYRGAERLFEETLAKLTALLRKSGYCGYINLNTIINERGVWPLEFTCRFGYPGFAILDALHEDNWDAVLSQLVKRDGGSIRTKEGFAVGVVVTVPPFPYPDGYEELGRGTPICFREMSDTDRDSLHLAEVTMKNGQLRTAGAIGYTMVVTGAGTTIEEAREAAYSRVNKVVIPNARYRNDIGVRLIDTDWTRLAALGWVE